MRFVVEEGKTMDEAVEKGLKKLGVSKHEVRIDVMEEGKNKGLFGFGTTKSVKVKISLLQNEKKSVLTEMLTKILELMDIKAEIIEEETKETITLEIRATDAAVLIGKRGQTLNALEFLLTLMYNKTGIEMRKRIVLDTEDYRRRRREVLINLAKKSAQDVIATKQEIELEPMPSQERYVIHSTLQNYPQVDTQSRGEGIERRVVILPKKS